MKILVAVDGSTSSERVIKFVANLLQRAKHPDVAVTLFHCSEGRVEPGKRDDHGEAVLNAQRKTLESSGIPAKCLSIKVDVDHERTDSSKVTAALSIIKEMKRGEYDVVCLGRRGAASAEGAFSASMAEKVLHEARGHSVWVID